MILHPNIDPVVFYLGPLHIRWYGLMYLLSFVTAWLLAHVRIRKNTHTPSAPEYGWSAAQFDDLVTWVFLGVIAGGRIGYILFYDLMLFIDDPIEIFRIWHGGMSFHGGLLGVLAAFWHFARKSGRSFLDVSDLVAPLVPIGLFFGRVGNFINAELWGKTTKLSWGVLFPGGGPLPRHPSQLYEAMLEGLVLFVILWLVSQKKRAKGLVSGLFALLYGIFRFAVEFVREPDAHLGYLAFGWLTMGQLLCIPLILIGILLIARSRQLCQ